MKLSSRTAADSMCSDSWASRRLDKCSLRSLCSWTVKVVIACLALFLLLFTLTLSLSRWSSDEGQVLSNVVGRQQLQRTATGNRSIEAQFRRLPDVRPTRCRDQKYDVDSMKRSATLVVPFSDYEFYDAEVTLAGVFYDAEPADRDLLAEIILVDVASSLKYVQRDVKLYVETLKNPSELQKRHNLPVRLIRIDTLRPKDSEGSHGHWPLEVGANAAQTDVVVFVRPGVIVGRGWLAPIKQPLMAGDKLDNRTSAVESHIDRRRSPINLAYQKTEDDLIPIPAWSLAIRMRRIPFESNGDQKSNGSEPEVPLYRAVPVLRGSAFAVRMSELKTLGGMFDDGLDVEGGGEYLELSFRLWMCGNGIQQATCSRVGVPDLYDDIRVVSPLNGRRLADTWFGSYEKLIARFGGTLQHDLAAAGDNEEEDKSRLGRTSTTFGSTTLDKKRCKDFDWYLKTASLGGLIAPHAENSIAFGFLQARTGYCARIGADQRIDLNHCQKNVGPQPDTIFELTTEGRLLLTMTGRCVQVVTFNYMSIGDCQVPLSNNQTWQLTNDGDLISQTSKMCAAQVSDPDPQHPGRQIMMVQDCSQPKPEELSKFKKWTFVVP